jgi:predicted nucleotidyltransferase
VNQQILEQIKLLKRQLIPNDRLILFGSQARGDARPDSDWDLLVLLDKPSLASSDDDFYGYPFAEIGWAYGVYLSAKVFARPEWEKQRASLFYKNVEQEGIEIT